MRKTPFSVITSFGQGKTLSPDGNRTHDLSQTGRPCSKMKRLLISSFRSQEFVSEPAEPSQTRARGLELKRSQSADELSTSDYGMFEQRRASGQDVVRRGEMGRDGYMRMKHISRESADVTDGGFQMGTVDVAIGGIGTPDTRRRSNQLYGMEEHEITFSGDNGGRNVYYLDNGGYRTEEWYNRGGRGTGQLSEEGFREIHVEHQPMYTEIQPDSAVSKINCLNRLL